MQSFCPRPEILLDEMTAKELATTVWSLARLDYPASSQLKHRLGVAIKAVLNKISEEPYLLENQLEEDSFAMLDREVQEEINSILDQSD